jgi:hypothetical protein
MSRLLCWLIGHQYRVSEVFTPDTRRVCCARCSGQWAMNDRVRVIVPWSDEFERFYRENKHILNED